MLRGTTCPSHAALGGSLVCCQQARLPAHPGTFLGNDIPGTRGGGICWIEIGCQKRRVQVTLHRPDATGALVPAL
jgi:hypothetical protein